MSILNLRSDLAFRIADSIRKDCGIGLRTFHLIGAVMSLLAMSAGNHGMADTFHYVDWTTASPANGTASGAITLPDSSIVNVEFEVLDSAGAPGSYFFAQTAGGTNYWVPSAPYISTEVENAPPDADILALVGGISHTYRISLSEPIKDPIMAIVSLGTPSVVVEYDFDRPFTIVSQGTGFWGGNATALTKQPGDVLRGFEGHGTIRFDGTFDSFSWTVAQGESWHGFTYGIRTTAALEPDVPEPGTLAMLLVTAAAMTYVRWR